MASQEATAKDIESASAGIRALLNDDVTEGRKLLAEGSSPFHLLGIGVLHFLEAALGMEEGLMPEAVASLTAAEAGAKAAARAARSVKPTGSAKYPIGLEYEICQADAVVLLGLTQALSESYMGYLQCIAHGKFGKMYKQVFPHGLGSYGTPAHTPMVSRQPSTVGLASASAPASGTGTPFLTPGSAPTIKTAGGLFGRLTGKSTASQSTLSTSSGPGDDSSIAPNGPVEEVIVAGAAFGFGLFNLVFSLLPNKVKRLVGFLGYQSDRRLGLEALNVAAGVGNDVHSSFAAYLVLMTYNGVVLLLTGWQADEERIVKQYREILSSVQDKYPNGSLWLLNRAKLERMTLNPSEAIRILKGGLSPERSVRFVQADALLVFELAWTLLADRKYEEAAETFLKIKELNSWSHATYTFIAAEKPEGKAKARELLDSVPQLLDRKKIGGRELPTEAFIQKRIDFYKRKQVRRAGPGTESDYIDSIFISPAEVWNTHSRITNTIAQEHIANLVALSPAVITPSSASVSGEKSKDASTAPADLDTADEIAIRNLLLGILHRADGAYELARTHLEAVVIGENDVEGKWTGQVSKFELAVLDLREVTAAGVGANRDRWSAALKSATTHLDQAAARSNANVDLSSRLDSRIALLRDEIELKTQALGLK
ncbi:hypothetical protein BDV93DRAFT_537692 [Ceratobasidium sp. AG-I]|nr:hypothetical protein BDV93DRAFT_537692 [Ceratobasidium sp. AG-I]